MIDGIEELLRDHPGSSLVVLITLVGVLTTGGLLCVYWRDWRTVRAGNGAGAYVARANLAGAAMLLAIAIVLCLLSVRGLVSVIEAIHALPPAARAAALRQARHLTMAQYEVLALYIALVLLVVGDGARALWARRRFARKYGPWAAKRGVVDQQPESEGHF